MKSANEFYYICPKGHLTVGLTDRKKKCDQKIQEIKIVKKGKAGIEKEVTRETICNEEIIETHPMPKELDFFNIWDSQLIKAFLIGQDPHALREGFLIDIQRVCTVLRTKIDDLEKQINDKEKSE